MSEVSVANIPVFILAGGMGTRLSEETSLKPKPMIEIGDTPILVHIMRFYYSQGFRDFVICGGYKVWDIKQYFLSYEMRSNDLEIDHRDSLTARANSIGSPKGQERWRVRVLDTGLDNMTGSRIAMALDKVSLDTAFEHFAVTYGDGLASVLLRDELVFHMEQKKIGTVLGVRPDARWGELDIENDTKVTGFLEKPENRSGFINGGFFFFNREFRNYLSLDKNCILEREPLKKLAEDSQLVVFKHDGFWQAMDTLRDKNALQALWEKGDAPWVI